jgi:hypothetical protein
LIHRATPKFWRCYAGLPKAVQSLADEKYELLKKNPKHPSLHFKKVGRLWACRVGLHHRALGADSDSGVVWFWIGTHAEYDKLVG